MRSFSFTSGGMKKLWMQVFDQLADTTGSREERKRERPNAEKVEEF